MRRIETEVLVIGSGIAGLYYAIHCAEFARVVIVTKGNIGESNTMFAQGGISAVISSDDSVENHVRDTLLAGDGLCNEKAVRMIAENAKQAILDLEKLKVHFDKTQNGSFDLHREGGHSHARVVHTADETGKEVENTLSNAVRNHKNITVLENCFGVDLCIRENLCHGVSAIDKNNGLLFIQSLSVMLATGGAGQVYVQNTNPEIATGDGFAMAHRAGAQVANMEFVQFHPTTLYSPAGTTFLITEALRGFGAELKTKNEETFMHKYHPMKSLAPRDVVTRAIISEMKKSGEPCVYLDARNIGAADMQKHFPNITAHCTTAGLNLSEQMIPVVPAAHYMCGGVVTDLNAKTSIKNLYACGEVTCTGVHGANRLASNSLLEGLVFAQRAANDTKKLLSITNRVFDNTPEVRLNKNLTENNSKGIVNYLQNLMWNHAGIIRNYAGLKYCLDELTTMREKVNATISIHGISVAEIELLNMIETSILIVEGALARKESRGCHYREDFPAKLNITKADGATQQENASSLSYMS